MAEEYAEERKIFLGTKSKPIPITVDDIVKKAKGNRPQPITAIRMAIFTALRHGPNATYREIAQQFGTSHARIYESVRAFEYWEERKNYPLYLNLKAKLVERYKYKLANLYKPKKSRTHKPQKIDEGQHDSQSTDRGGSGRGRAVSAASR